MKTAIEQLATYADYHRDRRNIATHRVGVPMIMLAVAILLSRPALAVGAGAGTVVLSPAVLVAVAVCLYWLRLDRLIGALLTLTAAASVAIGSRLAAGDTTTWLAVGGGLFAIGWAVQFVGHGFEGRKPAFLDDLAGLLIGPMFVLAEILFTFGLLPSLQAGIEERVGPARRGPHDGASPGRPSDPHEEPARHAARQSP